MKKKKPFEEVGLVFYGRTDRSARGEMEMGFV